MSTTTIDPHRGAAFPPLGGLAWAGFACLAVAAVTLAAMGLDARHIGDASVWLKPFKFLVSGGLHLVTVALAVQAMAPEARQGRLVRTAGALLLAATLFEVGYITLRGALGLPSHFAPGLVGGILYGLMGLAATIMVGVTALLGWMILRRPAGHLPGAVVLGAGLGLLVAGLAGLGTGWAISIHQGPVVGIADGVAVPVFGWSRSAGDLRVAHFIGLHAAQGLALLGLALRGVRRESARKTLLAAGALWSGVTLGAMVQALAGIPAFAMP